MIVLSYNSERFIKPCLSSVFQSTYPNLEVILVDNGSSDGSLRLACEDFGNRPNFKVFRMGRNLGFAAGNNAGVRVANGEYIAFLNPDTEVHERWLDGLVRIMAQDLTIAIVQPKILLLRDSKTFDSAGDYIDHYGASLSLGGDWDETDVGQYEEVREIFAARGAALIIRSQVFTEIGGFDESYFLDYEDIDLCWRARLAGYKVVYVPASVVFHAGSPRRFEQRRFSRAYHPLKNRYVTMIKNYEFGNLFRFLVPELLLIFLPSLATDVIRGKLGLCLLKLRALSWIVVNLRRTISKRSLVQHRVRKVPDSEVERLMIKTTLHRRRKFGVLSKKIGTSAAIRWYARPLVNSLKKRSALG